MTVSLLLLDVSPPQLPTAISKPLSICPQPTLQPTHSLTHVLLLTPLLTTQGFLFWLQKIRDRCHKPFVGLGFLLPFILQEDVSNLVQKVLRFLPAGLYFPAHLLTLEVTPSTTQHLNPRSSTSSRASKEPFNTQCHLNPCCQRANYSKTFLPGSGFCQPVCARLSSPKQARPRISPSPSCRTWFRESKKQT